MKQFNKHLKQSLLLPPKSSDMNSCKSASIKHWLSSIVNLQLNLLLIIAFLVIALFSNQLSYGQTAENTDWQLLKESEGVKAYYMVSNCSSENIIHLRIVNSNAVDKKLIWMASMKNGDANVSALPTMPPKALKGGEEISSDCNNSSQFLSMPLNGEFEKTNLQFDLIVLP